MHSDFDSLSSNHFFGHERELHIKLWLQVCVLKSARAGHVDGGFSFCHRTRSPAGVLKELHIKHRPRLRGMCKPWCTLSQHGPCQVGGGKALQNNNPLFTFYPTSTLLNSFNACQLTSKVI